MTGVTRETTETSRTRHRSPRPLVAVLGAGRRWSWAWWAVVVAASRGTAGAVRQAVEVYPVPGSGTFQLSGLGFGHGIGMSQFGAEGMGRLGKTLPGDRQVLLPGHHGSPRSRAPGRSPWGCPVSCAAPRRGRRRRPARQGLVTQPQAGDAIALPGKVGGEPVRSYRVVRDG